MNGILTLIKRVPKGTNEIQRVFASEDVLNRMIPHSVRREKVNIKRSLEQAAKRDEKLAKRR
jgi:hypothetical protein